LGGSGRARVTYVVLAGAVMLAAAGGGAVGLGAPGWLAGAVGAASALVAAVIVDRVYNARDTRSDAMEARRRVLDPLTPPEPEDQEEAAAANRADPLALLRADRSPMPFRGRGRQLRELAEWRDDEKASPVLLLSGSAGVGKSRLAIEFGRRAPRAWEAGWLHAGAGGAVVDAVTACGDPAVILVDDADGRTDLVPLLNRLAEQHGEPAVRVILVTRSAAGLRASLTTQVEERYASIASGAIALELEPEGGQDDQSRWFGEAVRAFATALDRPVPVLAEVFARSRSATTAPFVMIAAQALLAVLAASGQIDLPVSGAAQTIGAGAQPAVAGAQPRDPPELSLAEITEALTGHEKRRWDALAAAWAWGAGGLPVEALRERAIVALASLGADGDAEAEAVLRRVPQLRDALAERLFTIASWVAALYPASDGTAPRIRPDLVGEWLVVSRLTGDPALARSLRGGMSDEQAALALGLLARAADWIEAAGPLFGEFAGGDVRRQVLAAAQAAKTGQSGRHLLDAVVALQLASADDWSLDELIELAGLIPAHVLLLTRAGIAQRVVALYRALATDDPAAYRAGLAEALDRLGIALDRVGRYQEALDATQESLTLRRTLANDNPAAHQAGLATALANLGVDLDQAGRHPEALDARTESVRVYRELATRDPDLYQAEYQRRLGVLRREYEQRGMRYEAIFHDLGDPSAEGGMDGGEAGGSVRDESDG
jgi:tetratricopeptide (TPR) repeat protein